MEPVVIVGPLTDITLALARLFIQKGLPIYVITTNHQEWMLVAPDVFAGQNTITEDTRLSFAPSYTVLVPTSSTVPEEILQMHGKKVSVISHEYMHETPSLYSRIVFPSTVKVHPKLSTKEKVEEIVRQVFSFGGNITVFTDIQKLAIPQQQRIVTPEPSPIYSTPLFLRNENTNSVASGVVEEEEKEQEKKVPEIKEKSVKRTFKTKKVMWVMGIIITLLLLPFTVLGIATALTLVGMRLITMGELSLARTAFAASESIANVATVIPGSSQSAYHLKRVTTTGEQGSYVIEQVNQILEGVFSGQRYPLTELSQELKHELEIIHRELSFLEADLLAGNSLASRYIPLAKLQQLRQAALSGADIAGRLPSLLGVDTEKTYMVLLQNNMELRPTGGFIGSFALLNFSGGRLIDAPVFDVYSADGQLKGHVEPPAPIKEYLGEGNWYLRDSNWDPDFPTSASRAEWFLDKTIDRPVDGVIAIDLEFVRQLIAEQGELNIEDFDMKLTKDNFYEVLQSEVHKDFFPGSRKKAAVLTATMNALMNNLLKQVEDRNISLATVTAEALSGRHIQIHLEDPVLQQQIQVLGWAGEAKPGTCGENCEQIWVGLAEANVGVNKANYFIERTADLDTKWSNGLWEHELTVTIVNSARGEAVNQEHNYETYIRVMAAKDAKFDRALVQTANGRETITPEIVTTDNRTDAGAFVSVPAGETRVVTFLWSDKADIDPNKAGAIELFWRKQGGIDTQQITMEVTLPESSLISSRQFKYNSDLKTDFIQRVSFPNNNQ